MRARPVCGVDALNVRCNENKTALKPNDGLNGAPDVFGVNPISGSGSARNQRYAWAMVLSSEDISLHGLVTILLCP